MIKLIYLGDSEITVLFDRKTLDLRGWQITDQYNNSINFSDDFRLILLWMNTLLIVIEFLTASSIA